MTDSIPRRQRLSAALRRDQLSAAAVAVVAELGYQAATAEAIARQAGVSKGLLWHYFADLEDLMAAAARGTLIALRSAVATDVDLTGPAPELIRAAVRRAAALGATHATELRALRAIVINLRDPDGTPRLGPEEYAETYAHQEDIFRRGQRDGDFRDDLDPHLLAVIYQGSVDTMLSHLDTHPEADVDHVAATVADVLLGGIGRDRSVRSNGASAARSR